MAIRSILVGASGGAASDGALDVGCRLAGRFHARLEAFHVRVDAEHLRRMMNARTVPFEREWAEQVAVAAATLEETTQASFARITARYGLERERAAPGKPGAWWRSTAGNGPRLLALHARFFDLVVLGRSQRVVDEPHTDAVEEALLYSGRPILLAPERPPETIGDIIALGWNGSASAVRALAGALPLLVAAKEVVIITIGEERDDGVDLLKPYLSLHTIEAEFRAVPRVAGADLGGQLLSAARDAGADLLVMGGYGRKPWREFLFGGATREIVEVALLPIFLAH